LSSDHDGVVVGVVVGGGVGGGVGGVVDGVIGRVVGAVLGTVASLVEIENAERGALRPVVVGVDGDPDDAGTVEEGDPGSWAVTWASSAAFWRLS
jgi:hypothetical protein